MWAKLCDGKLGKWWGRRLVRILNMDKDLRNRRRKRIRARVQGTAERPRASVFRSLKYIYVQLINDESQHTLASTRGALKEAKKVGEELAKSAKKVKITKVTFDRGGYRYHGRVKAVAEGMREGGLQL